MVATYDAGIEDALPHVWNAAGMFQLLRECVFTCIVEAAQCSFAEPALYFLQWNQPYGFNHTVVCLHVPASSPAP